jgi:hypothetical protein
MNIVSRLGLAPDEVDAAVDDARRWFRDRGRAALTWEVTTASTPSDLRTRLLRAGMRPADQPHVLALACTEPPMSASPGVTVEQVRTDEQYADVARILAADDGFAPSDEWLRCGGLVTRFLARIDGVAVATADITPMDGAVFLGGAVTVPDARGPRRLPRPGGGPVAGGRGARNADPRHAG